MDQVDIDCLSCAYPVKDFASAVNAACGHGIVHRNCLYFQTECPTCDAMLTQSQYNESITIPFQPSHSSQQFASDQNFKDQLAAINQSLKELKSTLDQHNSEKKAMSQQIQDLQDQLKERDNKINDLQKEIYELKLEKVDQLKKDLEDKLKVLQ